MFDDDEFSYVPKSKEVILIYNLYLLYISTKLKMI
jgi:hypothetical protein